MTIYIFHTINTVCFDNKWSYGMGKLRKKLTHDADFIYLSSAQRKKLLLSAVATIDQ